MKAQNQRVNGSGITQLHRTASINEMSGRYRILPAKSYVPDMNRMGGKGKANKQGTEGELSSDVKHDIYDRLKLGQANAWVDYEWLNAAGLANELARINLPVSAYTEWFWKIDLHNFLHFCGLRMDPHAQWEVRQYAVAMYDIVRDIAPMSCEAWEEHFFHGVRLSRSEKRIMREFIVGLVGDQELPISQELKDILSKIGFDVA